MTLPLIASAKGVSHSFHTGGQSVDALRDINLTIAAGDMCVVSGESGSGKTTLLLVLCGLLRPSAGGEVKLFNDDPLYEQDYRRRAKLRRHRIGFMLPNFRLLPYLNAEDNIRVACARVAEVGGRIERLLEVAGLSARRRHRPAPPSGRRALRRAGLEGLLSPGRGRRRRGVRRCTSGWRLR